MKAIYTHIYILYILYIYFNKYNGLVKKHMHLFFFSGLGVFF